MRPPQHCLQFHLQLAALPLLGHLSMFLRFLLSLAFLPLLPDIQSSWPDAPDVFGVGASSFILIDLLLIERKVGSHTWVSVDRDNHPPIVLGGLQSRDIGR